MWETTESGASTMAKPYARLRAQMSPASRSRAARRAQAMLAAIRRQEQLTQAELAKALGVSQAAISKLERRKDVSIRTLRRYVEAAGGKLTIVARLPSGDYELNRLGV